MPTYNVFTSNLALTNFQKNKIAAEISQHHEAATGADSFYAQINYHKIEEYSHFLCSIKSFLRIANCHLCNLFAFNRMLV